jgi:NHLM bacteriocin system secretion protein
MQGKEQQLFRKESLERLSSPERLDQLMNVVDPRAWLPLATMGSLVVVAILWSVFGRIPLTVVGEGVLIQPRRVVQFQAPGDGEVLKLNIQPGQLVEKGAVLGIISQPLLEQQLQQERDNLAKLLRQNQDSNQLQRKRLRLDRENLARQRANLEANLSRESLVPELRQKNLQLINQNRISLQKSINDNQTILPQLQQKNLTALKEKRESLKRRVQEITQLLPQLKERREATRRLLQKQLVTGDIVLSAERDYLQSLSQLSELEAQLKQQDVEETQTQRQYLQNSNEVDQLKSKLQELNVQQVSTERDYLQSLNQIDSLKTQIEQIKSQEAKLAQEELEDRVNKTNRIREVKNRIAQLGKDLEDKSQIVSEYRGKVLEVAVAPGQIINTGTRLGTINAEDPQGKLLSLAYFPDKDGKKIKSGMEVQVTPSLVKRERYGGLVGKVSEVSPFPVTPQTMTTLIGSQTLADSIIQKFSQGGSAALVQVFADLETDANTSSGYKWSSSKGPPLQLDPGTTTQVRVKVGEVAPISYVIPILRSLTGLY